MRWCQIGCFALSSNFCSLHPIFPHKIVFEVKIQTILRLLYNVWHVSIALKCVFFWNVCVVFLRNLRQQMACRDDYGLLPGIKFNIAFVLRLVAEWIWAWWANRARNTRTRKYYWFLILNLTYFCFFFCSIFKVESFQ